MMAKLVMLPGDGIGPEIVHAGRQVLEAVARRFGHTFEFDTRLIGGAAIDATHSPLPEDTLSACLAADAVLLGAVGGPAWSDPASHVRPEQGLLGLRKGMGLFANLRPVTLFPELLSASPLRAEVLEGVDMIVVRELTGGIYFGEPRFREPYEGGERAVDTLMYTTHEIARVVRLAFTLAESRRGKVTSVDKANVLESSRLWRQVTSQIAQDYPHVMLEHQLVDSAAMRLVTDPQSFDVMVTENMFGDILSDEAAVLTGSLGMLPSASLGDSRLGLYEPIHGSAPDIAGQGVANPVGTILSAALLLRHSLGLTQEAQAVEQAVGRCVTLGVRTRDLKPAEASSTEEVTMAIVEGLRT
ncbi:MAG: 3-isopropylmalate dehydrogenase [Myxococcales bacterium]|nr:3-isopropylmalate dehydrogenase [Myxococcales bacterium]